MGKQSIIHTVDTCHCFICKRYIGNCREEHHALHGTFSRKLADEDGLTVFLCPDCHRGTNGVHGLNGHEKDAELKELAQKVWESTYAKSDNIEGARKEFIERYGRSYILD